MGLTLTKHPGCRGPSHITRTSKGTPDELYCKGVDVKEEILKSDSMDMKPNTELHWRDDIKDILK